MFIFYTFVCFIKHCFIIFAALNSTLQINILINMKNKELQDSRMRGYFIQSTKDILKGEGLKALSVRNVAERAGYSYTTMYNYFKDINDLIFLCVEDFQTECEEFVAERTSQRDYGIERFKISVFAWANYFVQYPGVFELFYIERTSNFGHKQNTIDIIATSFERICMKELEHCCTHNMVPMNKMKLLEQQLKYTIIGVLLLYLNRRTPILYPDFSKLVNDQLDIFLGL